MNAFDAFFDLVLRFPLVETIGWVLVHFVWQGAVIGVAGWLLLRSTYKSAPGVRYALACGLMLACIAAPAATFLVLEMPGRGRMISRNAQPDARELAADGARAARVDALRDRVVAFRGREMSAVAKGTQDFLLAAVERCVPWTVPVWFLGILFLGARLFFGWCRIQAWRIGAIPATDVAVNTIFARLARGFPRGGRVRLLVCAAIPGPLTLGWLKPVVLLPAQILTGLSQAQLEAVLAHEMAHIRRHDYLANLVQSAIEIVLFYHPVTWWLGRRIREIREECCDEEAMRACPGRLAYAEALAAMAEQRLASGLAMAATSGSLFSRISRLLGRPVAEPVPMGKNAAGLLAMLLALGMFFGLEIMATADSKTVASHTSTPVEEKLKRIMIPKVEFHDATVGEAIEWFRRKSVELDATEKDPARRGVSIVVDPLSGVSKESLDTKFTLVLTDIPLGVALDYTTRLAGLKIKTTSERVGIVPYSISMEPLVETQYKLPPAFRAAATRDARLQKQPSGTPREILSAFGVEFPEGATAEFSDDDRTLTVRNTQANQDLVFMIIGWIDPEHPTAVLPDLRDLVGKKVEVVVALKPQKAFIQAGAIPPPGFVTIKDNREIYTGVLAGFDASTVTLEPLPDAPKTFSATLPEIPGTGDRSLAREKQELYYASSIKLYKCQVEFFKPLVR